MDKQIEKDKMKWRSFYCSEQQKKVRGTEEQSDRENSSLKEHESQRPTACQTTDVSSNIRRDHLWPIYHVVQSGTIRANHKRHGWELWIAQCGYLSPLNWHECRTKEKTEAFDACRWVKNLKCRAGLRQYSCEAIGGWEQRLCKERARASIGFSKLSRWSSIRYICDYLQWKH